MASHSDAQEHKSAHPLRKKVLRWGLIGILILLALEFVVYFGSNIFLAGIAREKLNQSTQGVYEIGFNRLNLSLIRRGFFLDGIVLKPFHPENSKSDQVLFDFKLDEVAFTGLWYDFFDGEFSIKKIKLDNPDFSLIRTDSDPNDAEVKGSAPIDTFKVSAIKILETEIKKSLSRLNLNGFYVDQIEIDHANLFFFNFLSQSELKAENTFLIVRELDWTTTTDWVTPFNAKGFEFVLDQVIFPLPDGIHTLTSDRVFISSLDKTVDIKNFSLFPDFDKKSRAYYTLGLDRLRIGNADLNKAFMTSELEIDELILDSPMIKVARSPNDIDKNAPTGDLNELIRGKLKSIAIKELSVNGASFLKSELEDTLKNRIQLDRLDFKMVGFYLGEDSLKRENQFFYGEDASMQIQGSKLYLGDGVHVLEGKDVQVSSFKDELIVSNLSILPRQEAMAIYSPRNLIRLELPEFALLDADLKKLYQSGELVANQILIDHPSIEFTELGEALEGSIGTPITEVVAGFLNRLEVKTFQVNEGTVQFKDQSGRRSNDIGFDQFSLQLDDLELKPDSKLAIQEQLQIQNLSLNLNKYRLKLRDNLHLILADQLTIDSKRNLLEVRNLSIQPENQDQIQAQLDSYGKTSVVDFFVPLFRAEGVDVKAAFFDQDLIIGQISLPRPEFLISTYRAKVKRDSSRENPGSSDDIEALLLGYFNTVQIDSVNLDKAKVNYRSLVQGKQSRLDEDNLSLRLKNFSLGIDQDSILDRSLFSEEVDLTFNNYSFSLAGGKYVVETDYLNYNSKTKSIEFDDLILIPGEGFESRVALGLTFPKVQLKGVNIEEFVFENLLKLEVLEIDQGEIEIAIDRKVNAASKTNAAKQGTPRKTVDYIQIDTIRASNSSLQLNYLGQNEAQQSIKTGFDLVIHDFYLDSMMVDARDLGSLYALANLNLKDFTFALPDSVHTLKFSNVALGNQRDEIIFSAFQIIPKDHFGKSGNPVIEAKIDQLSIRKNQMQEVLETKKLDLKQIRLTKPVVDVYLDSIKPPSEPRAAQSQKSSTLVESLLLGDVILENGKINFHRKGIGPIPRLGFPKVDVALSELGIDLLDPDQRPDLTDLARKKLNFNLKGYSFLTPDSLYKIDFGNVNYKEGDFSIDDLYYRPVLGNYGYLRSLPYQTDAVTARVEKLEVKGMDPVRYLEEGLVKAEEVLLDGAGIDLFRDKRMPIDSSVYKPMPQFLLEHAKVNADVLSIRIRNSRVRYFEFAPKATMPGMITFDSIQMDMAPFFLRKKDERYPVDKVRLGLQAQLMGESDVQLEALLFFEEHYPMDVNVKMNNFEFGEISDFLSKSLFIKAVQGAVTDGTWNFRLNENFSYGEMQFGYQDLKIQFLDSLTLEPGLGKLRILTFGANLLAKNSNPRGSSSKMVRREIYLERDKRKFVISAWWKSTFTGLRGTLGLGRPKVPKEIRKEEE